MVESLDRLGIRMDKYKTSEMGRALKAVYHGKLTVKGAIKLAQREITAVFPEKGAAPEQDRDDGVVGMRIGTCPLCGADIVRGRYGYSCSAYKSGCKFRIGNYICGRVIPVSAAQSLLSNGKTPLLRGFVSKAGKPFDAALRLNGEKVVFDFPAKSNPTA